MTAGPMHGTHVCTGSVLLVDLHAKCVYSVTRPVASSDWLPDDLSPAYHSRRLLTLQPLPDRHDCPSTSPGHPPGSRRRAPTSYVPLSTTFIITQPIVHRIRDIARTSTRNCAPRMVTTALTSTRSRSESWSPQSPAVYGLRSLVDRWLQSFVTPPRPSTRLDPRPLLQQPSFLPTGRPSGLLYRLQRYTVAQLSLTIRRSPQSLLFQEARRINDPLKVGEPPSSCHDSREADNASRCLSCQ